MVEIHNSVAKIYEENKETLEIFECLDEFSDTQNFCDHYGFDIEDSCNAILIKAKKPEEFYAMFCVLGANRFCLLYTSPSPRDQRGSRMPSSA